MMIENNKKVVLNMMIENNKKVVLNMMIENNKKAHILNKLAVKKEGERKKVRTERKNERKRKRRQWPSHVGVCWQREEKPTACRNVT